jgi:acid phosphatase family membrane protein YuiD
LNVNLLGLFRNQVLIGALIAWSLAQGLKIPLEYLRTRRWNWALLLSVGGMPSSHSALMTAAAHGIGLYVGFNSPLFALAAVLTMIVIYDATGIRRQAGIHAQRINILFEELLKGRPLDEKDLREMLGHTPLEALGGILLGLTVATLVWLIWP